MWHVWSNSNYCCLMWKLQYCMCMTFKLCRPFCMFKRSTMYRLNVWVLGFRVVPLSLRNEISSPFLRYCGWLKFCQVPIFVVLVEGPIHELQYPWNGNVLYELWIKILWPQNLNPTNVSFLAHLSQRLKWAIVIAHRPSSVRPSVRPSSVRKLSHFRLLLWNRWTEFNETWQESRSQRPLPSLCFSGQSEKQDGRPGLWLAETFSTSL